MQEHQQQGVDVRWRRVLRRYLSPAEYERLRRVSGNWRRNPFAFDEQTGRFEPAETVAWGNVPLGEEMGLQEAMGPQDEADLDAVLKACDVLSDHLAELGPLGPPVRAGGAWREMQLTYDFATTDVGPGVDDAAVARRFTRLLASHPAFRVQEEDLGAVRRVRVAFRYRSDFEYQSKKSQLDWDLELARRLKEGRPFRGRRF